MEISVTERRGFKGCRRAWYYRNVKNLVPATEPRTAMWLGRGVHAALAALYSARQVDQRSVLASIDHLRRTTLQGLDTWIETVLPPGEREKLSGDELRQLNEQKALMVGMLIGYLDAYHAVDSQWEVLGVEEAFSVKLPGTRCRLVGHLDLLIRDGQGDLWVVDHKTCRSFTEPSSLVFDDQMSAYLYLVEKTVGETPRGAIYNQLRKKIPGVPGLLQSGNALSKAGIDTTPEVYLATIEKHGFDPNDYSEILTKIQAQPGYFVREPVTRSPREFVVYEAQLKTEYYNMRQARKDGEFYPNPSWDCDYCWYQSLCRLAMEGADTTEVEESLFRVQEGRGA